MPSLLRALALALLLGCGGDPARSGGLTLGDVTGLPEGNARGNAASHVWTATSPPGVDRCSCRVGTCADLHFTPGTVWIEVQTEGRVLVEITRPTVGGMCRGGMDADGRFWCGYA